jgi:mannitol/fructose-specific phosphotransferase system IIA component (Ntr-type)
VQKLTILFANSKKGISFDAEDGKPTHLFFMLIAPPQDSGHQYIKSLAVLTDRMQNSKLRGAVSKCEDYDSFCEALKEG